MYSFADVTDTAAPVDTVAAEPTSSELVMPPQMAFWGVVPLIDLTMGVYNFYLFNTTDYGRDFHIGELFNTAFGLSFMGAWSSAAMKHKNLDIFLNVSKFAIIA